MVLLLYIELLNLSLFYINDSGANPSLPLHPFIYQTLYR